MRLPRMLAATVAAALLIAPASALAATPPVIHPPTQLHKGLPLFTWTNGPAGETLQNITVTTNPTVDATGNLTTLKNGKYLSPLEGLASSKVTGTPLRAGTYYYNGSWRIAEPDERGYTPVQSFRIKPVLRGLKGKYTQYSSIPAFSATGSFVSNGDKATVLCRVYRGKKIISRQTKRITGITPYQRTNFYCSDLKVSERLDGKRLKLRVEVRSAGKKQVANKFFRAT